MMKYLRNYENYDELYDSFTIEKCQYWDNCRKDCARKLEIESDPKKKEKLLAERLAIDLLLYFEKGEHYLNKDKTVKEWMDRDKARDEKLENAAEPAGVRCLECSSRDMACTSRDLMSNSQGKEDEVLFMLQCEKCGKRRAYWEDGTEWKRKPDTCPKCRSEMQYKSNRKDKIIETIYSCPGCGYDKTDTLDLNIKEKPADRNFEKNRKKYCLSEKEGTEYFSQKQGLDQMKQLVDSWEEKKRNRKLYDAVDNIKKLTIAELQLMFDPLLEKAGYAKLEFERPDLQKDVILGFSLQDSKSGRSEWDSIHELQKLLKKSLESTNWRLMSDGVRVRYRLGFLQGRLRGVEGEENLRKIVESDQIKRDKKLSQSSK